MKQVASLRYNVIFKSATKAPSSADTLKYISGSKMSKPTPSCKMTTNTNRVCSSFRDVSNW